MKEKIVFLLFMLIFAMETACSQGNQSNNNGETSILYLHINNRELTATLVDSSSTRALRELLAINPIIINMSDYGGFEKVGSLGTTLPQNNQQITTQSGDLILYQGNQFVIYYDQNSWSLTRLGKINNVSQQELINILGTGSVVVTLSLTL